MQQIERKEYRGYTVAPGLCGRVGIFADGHQVDTVESVRSAMAKVDNWICGWRAMVASNHGDAVAALEALRQCGEAA
jgi:hypothetical protein